MAVALGAGLQAKVKEHMARSRSTPNLEKETCINQMDSFFLVIASTPRVEVDPTTPTPYSNSFHKSIKIMSNSYNTN
ncbi:hypothetical protein R6Q57_027934 [Mikania cordata]